VKEFTYVIKDELGIHARPAGLLIKKLQEFSSAVTILRGNDKCEGKKLLALMKLQIKAGQAITLQFTGDDEDAAAAAVQEYLTAIL